MKDLGNEFVEMEAVQNAADLRTPLFPAVDLGKMGRLRQCVPNLAVGKSPNTVIAIHHRLKELEIFTRERIEGFRRTAGWRAFATCDAIDFSNPGVGSLTTDRASK